MIKMEFDNYIFDLYGTLLDLSVDEHCAKTWKRWLRWLDVHNIRHPHYIQFRKEFFERDKLARKKAKSDGPYTYPEIDVIPIYRDLFEKYGNGKLPDDLIYKASYAFREASREYIKLFPGVEEYLLKIRKSGKHAYILSNAQASYTEPEIKLFGLDKLTDDYLMSSDYNCMKPDKAFFDILIDRYSMDRSKTLMHGDSLNSDIAGAHNAGIQCIHLAGENHPAIFYLK